MKKLSSQSQIVIIGAGIAGLAAAQRLHDAGLKVTVLEARNRIGGRIDAQAMLGMPVDLGASWIHGVIDNPLMELVKKTQATIKQTDLASSMLIYDENNRPLPLNTAQLSSEHLENLLRDAHEFAQAAYHDISIYDAIAHIVSPPQLQNPLLCRELAFYSGYNGTSLKKLSARNIYAEKLLEGGHYFVVSSYKKLLSSFATYYPILFNTCITAIDYSKEKINIITTNGNYEADAVIVTVPLSVLQKDHVQFTPALNETKKIALEQLGMGLLNKVILQFHHVFWPKNYQVLSYSQRHYQVGPSFLNYYFYTKKPILINLPAGENAEELEKLTDAAMVDLVMQVLKKLFGSAVPKPIKSVVTRWGQDPFSLGSYSYIKTNGKMEARQQLAEPIEEKLFFAGEATHKDFPATVHGAYLSGLREADRILNLIN